MSNIGGWLEQHDLGEFTAMFEQERVELETLRDLTEQDLKDLGLPLGSRKKLLRAIKALAEDESGQTDQGAAAIESQPISSSSGEAERRQLTIMFCDLVGSTQLSGELDLETYRNVLSTYQDAARAAVARYEGFIARYMGDRTACLFWLSAGPRG